MKHCTIKVFVEHGIAQGLDMAWCLKKWDDWQTFDRRLRSLSCERMPQQEFESSWRNPKSSKWDSSSHENDDYFLRSSKTMGKRHREGQKTSSIWKLRQGHVTYSSLQIPESNKLNTFLFSSHAYTRRSRSKVLERSRSFLHTRVIHARRFLWFMLT